MTSKEMVKLACQALEEKKAGDIRVLDISKVSVIADYFIIADGSNINQVQAMADAVTESLGKAGVTECRTEGYNSGDWILLDFQDVIVHAFNRENRLFYDLERIWRDGKVVDPETL